MKNELFLSTIWRSFSAWKFAKKLPNARFTIFVWILILLLSLKIRGSNVFFLIMKFINRNKVRSRNYLVPSGYPESVFIVWPPFIAPQLNSELSTCALGTSLKSLKKWSTRSNSFLILIQIVSIWDRKTSSFKKIKRVKAAILVCSNAIRY